jgi:hypothetical protein
VKRPPLFHAWWFCTPTGTRLGRATRRELREAQRIWWRHRDIRERHAQREAREIDDAIEQSWDEIGEATL